MMRLDLLCDFRHAPCVSLSAERLDCGGERPNDSRSINTDIVADAGPDSL